MNPVDVNPLGVVASLLLIALAVGISWRERLGLGRSIVWAAVRAIVQLTAIGGALGLVLADDAPILWAWIWVVGMVTIGGVTVQSRCPGVPGLFPIAWTALGSATVVSMAVVFGFETFPLEPRTLVPLAGMVLGNTIGATVLAARRTAIELSEHRGEIEVRLALGHPGRAAVRPHLAESMRTAITPAIEQTKIVGIVSLPGTMTGMLLAGVDPVDAVLTQTIVMFLILGSVALTAVVVGRGVTTRAVSRDHRLVLEALD